MVNKWIGIGNLGKDPEVRYTNNGTPVASFSIETAPKDTLILGATCGAGRVGIIKNLVVHTDRSIEGKTYLSR